MYRYALNSPAGFTDPTGESDLAEFIELLQVTFPYTSAIANGGEELVLPCLMARWSAAKFSYFAPLADLITNPQNAAETPKLEPAPLLALTGCTF